MLIERFKSRAAQICHLEFGEQVIGWWVQVRLLLSVIWGLLCNAYAQPIVR